VRTAVRRSPAARLAARRGAVFVEEAGWEIPASFGDDTRERSAIREQIALADISARAKVDVRGAVPESLPVPGRAFVGRIEPSRAVVFSEPGTEDNILRSLSGVAGPSTTVTDVTHAFAGFCLLGPDLDLVLERTTSWDAATLAVEETTGAPIVDVPALIARRKGSVPTIEVYVAAEYGRFAWSSLLEVVSELGGEPIGWQALRAVGWR
jgi:glycine cleavage system aminomethyltransferase T